MQDSPTPGAPHDTVHTWTVREGMVVAVIYPVDTPLDEFLSGYGGSIAEAIADARTRRRTKDKRH